MSQPYLSEIRMFAGNFAPRNWALCNGQLLVISSNNALFALIGCTYGGDCRSSFALPDLRGRLPMHMGVGPGLSPRRIGQNLGEENHVLTATELPVHGHSLMASRNTADELSPIGNVLGQEDAFDIYVTTPNQGAEPRQFPTNALGFMGGSRSHNNIMPSLVVNFIICMVGIFPSQR